MSDSDDSALITVGTKQFRLFGDPSDYIFQQIKSTRSFYENDLLDALAKIDYQAEGVVLDVGANIGNHSVFLAGMCKLPVLAIEPVPKNSKRLRQNIQANALEDLVDVLEVAVWSRSARLTAVNMLPDNDGAYVVSESTGGDVIGVTLDSVVDQLPRVLLLKIDVEGTESTALLGATTILRTHRPVVVTECHDISKYLEISAILSPFGYEPIAIRGRSDNYIWMTPEGMQSRRIDEYRRLFELDSVRLRERRTLGSLHQARSGIADLSRSVEGLPEAIAQLQTLAKGAEDRVVELYEAAAASNESSLVSLGRTIGHIHSELNSVLEELARLNSLGSDLPMMFETESRLILKRLEDVSPELATVRLEISQVGASTNRLLQRLFESNIHTSDQLGAAVQALDGSIAKIAERLERQVDLELDALREDAEVWAASYRMVSERLARVAPDSWRHSYAGEALRSAVSNIPESLTALEWDVRRSAVPRPKTTLRDPVRIGIASMPGRLTGLLEVLNNLAPQADDIHVYLNQYDAVPEELRARAADNVSFHLGDDLGDRGKFLFLDDFHGYYLTCDDDIRYPDYYVAHIIDGIERYQRKAVVGWHGSLVLDGFSDYYDATSRRVFAYYSNRPEDTPVHLLGTGATGFHTDTVRPNMDDYRLPNMADVWFGLEAQRKNVPLIVLRHPRDEALPIDRHAPSISNKAIRGQTDGLDIRATVTDLVRTHRRWELFPAPESAHRREMSVAIIGRTDFERWKKGGILKSCHLTASSLRQYGASVTLHDIETGDPTGLDGTSPDLVMIYVGDPTRPDFARVESLVAQHAALGRIVLINLSLQGDKSRSLRIASLLKDWDRRFRGMVRLFVFSNAARSLPELESVRDRVVVIPKTLSFASLGTGRRFEDTSGVFIGDYAKLTDPALTVEPAEEWISAIRAALPGVRISAVRQYSPREHRDLDVDDIFPYDAFRFVSNLRGVRLMVAPVKVATFEMVPMEAAASGIPIVYRTMPQSLSEYLGLSGIEIDTPDELSRVLPTIYGDAGLWTRLSWSAAERARSAAASSSAAQLYVQLSKLLSELNPLGR